MLLGRIRIECILGNALLGGAGYTSAQVRECMRRMGGCMTQTNASAAFSLYDMHSHLGFFAEPEAAVRELAQAGVATLCATVTPGEFEQLRTSELAASPAVRLGVGLHPWWIANDSCNKDDVERAAAHVACEHYVAEVGLDFAPRHDHSREEQVAAFDAILRACENGGHVLSVHAVRSASTVLDLLEAHGTAANNDVIFHWFSGSGAELARARGLGCFFSVNPRMLETRRGRAYAQQIPTSQLLLETDLPDSANEEQVHNPQALIDALEATARALAELRGEGVLPVIQETSSRLLEIS